MCRLLACNMSFFSINIINYILPQLAIPTASHLCLSPGTRRAVVGEDQSRSLQGEVRSENLDRTSRNVRRISRTSLSEWSQTRAASSDDKDRAG